jgi:hypothetical protein
MKKLALATLIVISAAHYTHGEQEPMSKKLSTTALYGAGTALTIAMAKQYSTIGQKLFAVIIENNPYNMPPHEYSTCFDAVNYLHIAKLSWAVAGLYMGYKTVKAAYDAFHHYTCKQSTPEK